MAANDRIAPHGDHIVDPLPRGNLGILAETNEGLRRNGAQSRADEGDRE